MRRPWVVLCLLVVTGATLGGVGSAAAGPGLFDVQGDFDRVQFRIVVGEDGGSRWTFRYERRLANDSERAQFAAFAERFRENETAMYRDFRAQATALADLGAESTGRNMTVTDFERNATVVTRLNTIGVVEMGFTWTGFAATEGDRVIVGDVFEGGLYLGASQSLVIVAGDGLRFRSVDPPGTPSGATLADSEAVTWRGERTFADNRPRVVLEREAVAATATAGAESGGSPSAGRAGATGTPGAAGGRWMVPALGGIAVLVGVGLTLLWYRSGAAGETSAGGATGGGEAEMAPESGAVMDDAERVDALLREHGGRMRQSAIVEETGWSKSKVSMVLSEMEESGEITKLRVGRENLISLPGREPEAARSPHDEE